MELARRVNRPTWLREAPDGSPGPCADVLMNDLATSSGRQSWWVVDHGKEDIAVAIASGRDQLSNVDLAIVATEELERLKILWERTNAETLYALANDRHCDLFSLSARAVCRLADRLYEFREAIERIREREVRDLLIAAIGRGDLELTGLRATLLSSLAKRLCVMQDPNDAALIAVIADVKQRVEAGNLDQGDLDPTVRERILKLEATSD